MVYPDSSRRSPVGAKSAQTLFFPLLMAGGLLAFAACPNTTGSPGDGDGDGDVTAVDAGGTETTDAGFHDGGALAPIVALSVTPDPALVAAGTTFAFTATGEREDGSTFDVTALADWTSSDDTIATVGNDPAGVAVVIAGAGTCDITAQLQGYSASAQLKVLDAVLQSITVEPEAISVSAGLTATLQAFAVFSDGSQTNVTSSATYTSTDVAVVTTDGEEITGVAPGVSNVVVTYEGQTANVTVTVSDAEVQSLALVPQNPSVALGQKVDFSVAATLSDGTVVDVTDTATFLVGAGLSDEGGGRVRGISATTAVVSASFAGVDDDATMSVGPLALVDVSSRDKHVLAVLSDGRVIAWGRNDLGQTTRTTLTNHTQRVEMSGLPRIVAAAAGGTFSALLDEDGNVWSVGGNLYGERGDGTTDSDAHTIPHQVDGLSNVIAIDAGVSHGLAQLADGRLFCWGAAYTGQCGRNLNDVPTPLEVPAVGTVIDFSAGSFHSAVVDSANDLHTMGWNLWGQTGTGTSGDGTDVRAPTAVDHFAAVDVAEVHTGWGHTVFRTLAGSVYGFGLADSGQLGVPPMTSAKVETPIYITGGVTQLASAYMSVLFQTDDGTVYGLGGNYWGTLAQGDNINVTDPVQIHGVGNVGVLSNIALIDGGGDNVLAIGANATVYTWGGNQHGEMGAGVIGNDQLSPTVVPLVP